MAARSVPENPSSSPAERVLGAFLDGWVWLAGRRLTLAFYAGLLLMGALVVVAAPHRIHRYAPDTFLYLDGGWRVYNGQRPYVDFYTGLGPVTFQLVALGFMIGGLTPAGIDLGFGVAALALGIWAWELFRRRMDQPAACLLALFVVALSIAPHAVGARFDILTYASLYNRLGYGLMAVVLVECICAPAAGSAKDHWFGGISSGAACLILLFLKPSFFLVAAVMLPASWVFRDLRDRRRLFGVVAGFAVSALLMLAYLRFDLGAIWYDFHTVAGARAQMTRLNPTFAIGQRMALKHAYDNAEPLVGLMLLAWMVAILPRARRTADYLDAWWPVLAAAAVFAADVALNTANGVQFCLPLMGVIALVLISTISHWWRAAGAPDRRAYRLLCGLAVVLGMLLFLPQAANDSGTLVYSAAQTVWGPPLPAHFQAVPLRRLLSRETPPDWDEPYNGKDLVDPINDGTALLQSASRPSESVIALDSMNPFSFALMRKPAEGGSPVLGASFFNPGYMPSNEWMIGGADLVMIPKNQTPAAAWLKQVFGEFVERNYALAAESKEWLLYRRKGR